MSNYRRADVQGGTYFFTVVTFQRRPFLCDEPVRTALRHGIEHTRKTHPFRIDGWVLLPDHLHCLWTLPPDDADFGLRWSMIKRFVTQHCKADLHRNDLMNASRQKRHESTVWQRRFWEHLIRDEKDFAAHLDYIHYNPVKHGHVRSAAAWPYSTFHRYVEQGMYDKDWAAEPDDAEDGNYGEP